MKKIWTWDNQKLQVKTSFSEILDLTGSRRILSVTGAGGKTTTIRRLAEECVKLGLRTAVTTTTHMKKEADFLTDPSFEKLRADICRKKIVWFGASVPETGKIGRMPEAFLEQIVSDETLTDICLIEADGAKGMPCKAPAEWEPVISGSSTDVLAVYGIDAVGCAFQDVAFRLKNVLAIVNKKPLDLIQPDDIAKLGASSQGGRKCVSDAMKYWIVLNKADSYQRLHCAEEICRQLDRLGVRNIIVTANGEAEV